MVVVDRINFMLHAAYGLCLGVGGSMFVAVLCGSAGVPLND